MRKLRNSELYDGIYVQCWDSESKKIVQTIYQIIIKNNESFYREKDSDWLMPGEIVKDAWWETPETISLNRNNKINRIFGE